MLPSCCSIAGGDSIALLQNTFRCLMITYNRYYTCSRGVHRSSKTAKSNYWYNNTRGRRQVQARSHSLTGDAETFARSHRGGLGSCPSQLDYAEAAALALVHLFDRGFIPPGPGSTLQMKHNQRGRRTDVWRMPPRDVALARQCETAFAKGNKNVVCRGGGFWRRKLPMGPLFVFDVPGVLIGDLVVFILRSISCKNLSSSTLRRRIIAFWAVPSAFASSSTRATFCPQRHSGQAICGHRRLHSASPVKTCFQFCRA